MHSKKDAQDRMQDPLWNFPFTSIHVLGFPFLEGGDTLDWGLIDEIPSLALTILKPFRGFLTFPVMIAFKSRVSRIRQLKLLFGGDLTIQPSELLGNLEESKVLDLVNDS